MLQTCILNVVLCGVEWTLQDFAPTIGGPSKSEHFLALRQSLRQCSTYITPSCGSSHSALSPWKYLNALISMGLVRTKSYGCKEVIIRVVKAQRAKEKEAVAKAFATNKWITKLPNTKIDNMDSNANLAFKSFMKDHPLNWVYNILIFHSSYYVVRFALYTFGCILIVFGVWGLDSNAMP